MEIDYIEEGPIVKVRLHGACVTCPMSTQTMTLGVERHIQMIWPEVYGVVQVL